MSEDDVENGIRVRVTFHDQQYWEGTVLTSSERGLLIDPEPTINVAVGVFIPWQSIRHMTIYREHERRESAGGDDE